MSAEDCPAGPAGAAAGRAAAADGRPTFAPDAAPAARAGARAPARLRVLAAGPLVTVQDAGRFGWLRCGVPASGPMDRGAFAIACAAAGAEGEDGGPPAGIEVSTAGLTLELCEGELGLALAGGGFIAELDGRPIGAWARLTLRAGQRLVLRRGPWGSWCTLAFAGRLQARRWLGSAATHATSNLGGGRLRPGQELTVLDPRPLAERALLCPVWARPRQHLHVVLGPQQRYFGAAQIETLLSTPFRLSDACDRMGLRLSGPPLVPQGALAIPSAPVLRGSVQVAGDGVATVLMADHQTTGGYPRIATVIDGDLDGLAQLRPRQALRFHAVTPEAARALDLQRRRARAAFLATLGPP